MIEYFLQPVTRGVPKALEGVARGADLGTTFLRYSIKPAAGLAQAYFAPVTVVRKLIHRKTKMWEEGLIPIGERNPDSAAAGVLVGGLVTLMAADAGMKQICDSALAGNWKPAAIAGGVFAVGLVGSGIYEGLRKMSIDFIEQMYKS